MIVENFVKNIGSEAYKRISRRLPLKILQVPPLPRRIQIEISNICNLNPYCPLCVAQLKGKRKKGKINYREFKNLIDDKKHHLKEICLSGHGEPTVNKDIWKMVGYAEEKGIRVKMDTNGTLLSGHIDDLLESGLSTIWYA